MNKLVILPVVIFAFILLMCAAVYFARHPADTWPSRLIALFVTGAIWLLLAFVVII